MQRWERSCAVLFGLACFGIVAVVIGLPLLAAWKTFA